MQGSGREVCVGGRRVEEGEGGQIPLIRDPAHLPEARRREHEQPQLPPEYLILTNKFDPSLNSLRSTQIFSVLRRR